MYFSIILLLLCIGHVINKQTSPELLVLPKFFKKFKKGLPEFFSSLKLKKSVNNFVSVLILTEIVQKSGCYDYASAKRK
jgi:hypothetical protein